MTSSSCCFLYLWAELVFVVLGASWSRENLDQSNMLTMLSLGVSAYGLRCNTQGYSATGSIFLPPLSAKKIQNKHNSSNEGLTMSFLSLI